VAFDNIFCTTVTSGDILKITPLPSYVNGIIRQLDTVSINTLKDCMQLVKLSLSKKFSAYLSIFILGLPKKKLYPSSEGHIVKTKQI
jgi:hypothetical protein